MKNRQISISIKDLRQPLVYHMVLDKQNLNKYEVQLLFRDATTKYHVDSSVSTDSINMDLLSFKDACLSNHRLLFPNF